VSPNFFRWTFLIVFQFPPHSRIYINTHIYIFKFTSLFTYFYWLSHLHLFSYSVLISSDFGFFSFEFHFFPSYSNLFDFRLRFFFFTRIFYKEFAFFHWFLRIFTFLVGISLFYPHNVFINSRFFVFFYYKFWAHKFHKISVFLHAIYISDA